MAGGFVSDAHTLAIGATTPGHYGAPSARVTLAETIFAAAWNVQGDPARPAFAAEVRRSFDIALPEAPNTSATSDALTALWVGPKSWLLIAGSPSTLTGFADRRDALNAAGGALFDLSAGRVAWTISGEFAATVLAKGCPLDFHPRVFAEGACAQSVLGHINALFYRPRAAREFVVMAARSFARDVWRTLCVSAAQYGYDVLPPGDFRSLDRDIAFRSPPS
jgi:sarcosine oxidase subunit gamma